MTNLDTRPEETVCEGGERDVPGVQVLTPRDVPLGGVRAMAVRRTLPQRARSFIGAWCFCDHYGPDDVARTGGMRVPPHPHTGLQTVSWLFSGEIEHRDSLGTHQLVRPGELNLMTAGHGISHSEDSTDTTTVLHGVQLWTALPRAHRSTVPAFEHHVPDVLELDGARVRVFLGSLAGSTSPVRTFSPLVGAELVLDAGTRHTLEVDPTFEHGVLVDAGRVEVAGTALVPHELAYLATGRAEVVLVAGDEPVRLVLIGGAPLGEQIVMWWNFVGPDHGEVVAARAAWQAQIGAEPGPPADDGGTGSPRFGHVEGHPRPPLPAPPLPNQRLLPRG